METVHTVQQFFGLGPHGLFLTLTYLGASAVLWPLLALYAWLVDPQFARRLGIVLAVSVVTNQILKAAFGTDRPYDFDAAVATDSARRTGGGHGFPSGHTQNAAAFWPAFAFRYHRTAIWIAALAVVFAVALSRIYLGVHLPADVTGGFVFGMVFAWVAGGWTGPTVRPGFRRLWGPLVGVSALALAFLESVNPAACGLLAGCFLARPDYEPPTTGKGRIAIVAGGIAALALVAGFLVWLPGLVAPDLTATAPARYLQTLIASLVAFDLWPRFWKRL